MLLLGTVSISKKHVSKLLQWSSMAVTIYDVARAAGVGIGTVSRVLNQSQSVKSSTREKVLSAIAALNYTPDPIARSMIIKRTDAIGVIVPFFYRPFSVEVLRGVATATTRLGQELVVFNVETNEQRDHYFTRLPMRRRVDGLIIISLAPDDEIAITFAEAGLPAVLVDTYSPLLTSLVINNVEGAYRAVKSLAEKGHRRIGFINGVIEGNFKFNQANDRLIGVHRALADAGIVFDPELMVTAEWSRAGGRQATHQLLNLKEPPTAIFAASDIQALGVLETARQLNLAVPEALSIIGFDGIELSELLELSTMQQPLHLMGELGVTKLMEHLADTKKSPELIRLDTSLLERRTTATLKSASKSASIKI